MEDINRRSMRSITPYTPYESSCNTDTEKDLYGTLERKFSSSKSHKRVISGEIQSFKVETSPTIRSFCGNCVRFERQVQELKKKLQKEKENHDTREKHMRQLDSLLQIKDKRLKEEEKSLKSEKNQTNRELEELKRLYKELHHEKIQLENDNKSFSKENSSLISNLKKAETKSAEIQKILKKFEDDKKTIEENIKASILKNLETRENNLKKKETEISLAYQKINYENELLEEKSMKIAYFEQNLIIQEQSIKLKYEELSNFSLELEKSEAKLIEDQNNFKEEVSNQLSYLRSRETQQTAQEKALKSKLSMLDSELENIETLKSKLQEQKSFLSKEIEMYKNLQLEILNEHSINIESDSEKNIISEEKEKYIEEMIERLSEEENKFSERWESMKKLEESLRNELDFYKKKCEQLEHQLLSKEPNNIPSDYHAKILSLQTKEEELLAFENNLNKERLEIDSTVELVKSLNNDLQAQKKIQDEEYKKIEKEKEKILELLKKQEERARTLGLKEQELLNFEQSLRRDSRRPELKISSPESNFEEKSFQTSSPSSILDSPAG